MPLQSWYECLLDKEWVGRWVRTKRDGEKARQETYMAPPRCFGMLVLSDVSVLRRYDTPDIRLLTDITVVGVGRGVLHHIVAEVEAWE